MVIAFLFAAVISKALRSSGVKKEISTPTARYFFNVTPTLFHQFSSASWQFLSSNYRLAADWLDMRQICYDCAVSRLLRSFVDESSFRFGTFFEHNGRGGFAFGDCEKIWISGTGTFYEKSFKAAALVLALSGCWEDEDERFDVGYDDGYAVGYNTTCKIRATLIEGDWQSDDLIETYSKYKFVFAMENKCVPGYVTEKILNAFVC